jgi:hypothetical protein
MSVGSGQWSIGVALLTVNVVELSLADWKFASPA